MAPHSAHTHLNVSVEKLLPDFGAYIEVQRGRERERERVWGWGSHGLGAQTFILISDVSWEILDGCEVGW